MKVRKEVIVPLGYGKYFRADSIVGLERIEEGRGPGRRTLVYVQDVSEPIVASRTEVTILSDMVEPSGEETDLHAQRKLLADILDTVSDIDPMLRTIVREQGQWDLDKLEARIARLLGSAIE